MESVRPQKGQPRRLCYRPAVFFRRFLLLLCLHSRKEKFSVFQTVIKIPYLFLKRAILKLHGL
jgi:hypothetical protein